MRILWLSRAPWETGGYSNQTALFTPRLVAMGHEVAIVGIQGIASGMTEWRGIPVYPMLVNDLRNDTIIGLHYKDWQADLMISLHDVDQVVDGSVLVKRFPRLLWALWAPIHSSLLSGKEQAQLRAVSVPIAMARFGERIARDHGLPLRYVPHGVDTTVLRPRERAEARSRLGWPADVFVAGMVAANVATRKAFPQHIEGFASFHRRYPDSMLYLHTLEAASRGLDLASVCLKAGLKIGRDVVFCDPYRYFLGVQGLQMATVYNGMDVLLMVTKGEGFGLPIVEAQACGVPVIIGDWSAMSELCFAGWKVRREESTVVENDWRLGSSDAIADRLEAAYLASRDPEQWLALRHQARTGALPYDVDRVTEEHWLPLLKEIERGIASDQARPMSQAGTAATGRSSGRPE
ncbi:MAG TPA: glycosyltransferase family 4 protein [Thermoanaerobaculia bacterium]|jgi:glycosyltransferase involved in cell wall biosynthesis|nr:glycosyltransferase family 4 protein [Thermoanaerobaculia bacterium]